MKRRTNASSAGLDDTAMLLYDGDCGFCTAAVQWMERHIAHLPEVTAYQAVGLPALGLTPEECRRAVQWIGPTGAIRVGADAIARVLLDAGGGWRLVGRTMRLPGVAALSACGYRLIARHRHRLPFGSPACELDAQSDGASVDGS